MAQFFDHVGVDNFLQVVDHGQDFVGIGGDEEDQAVAGLIFRIDGAAVKQPEHGLLWPKIAGMRSRALAQRLGIRHRHLAGELPFLRDNRLQVFRFLLREIVKEINHRPNHGDDKHQHHGRHAGEDRPHLVAKQILKDEKKELHCCLRGSGRW